MTGFKNITEVKRANKARGHYWFSPATVKSFKSRVETPVQGGFYWVESTTNYNDTAREYLAVGCSPDGDIQYLHGAQRFATKASAQRIIDAILKAREIEGTL